MVEAVYIHIPFCKTICSYCDFCKMYYNEAWADKYLDELNKEISNNYHNELIKTLYIGGGTPNSLNDNELEKLLNILKQIKLNDSYEYTIECNIELLTLKQIKLFKEYGINRVSIGVQTLNNKYLKFLNRNHTKEEVREKVELLKSNGIANINIDLIYAIPGETIDELKSDIDFILSLDIPHISTYSLMIEPNTVLFNKKIENIDEDKDFDMYELIINRLKDYKHYETSNFSYDNYESKHNLTYWNNLEYYGFGLGSSGYFNGIRYDNTKSLNNYLKGNYRLEENRLLRNEIIENEFILGLRKIDGININDFKNRYDLELLNIPVVKKLIEQEKLVNDGSNIKLNKDYLYIANEVLIEFLGEDYEK